MPLSPCAHDEKERLASLRRYAILDTPPEAAFDRITALAARLFDVPAALITLVDEHRQWFKSCQGTLRGDFPAETRCDAAFCTQAILSQETLIVEDAQRDPRFAGSPLVTGAMGLRFYAGAPLIVADGSILGTLCLVDFEPRSLTDAQRQTLQDLAAGVVTELELRRTQKASENSERLYRQMFENSPQPMWVYEDERWQFLAVNDTAIAQLGYSRDEFLSMTLFDIHPAEGAEVLRQSLQKREAGTRFAGVRCLQRKDGSLLWMEVASHAVEFEGHNARVAVAVDISERKAAEDALRQSVSILTAQLEATPDAILVADENHRILSHNHCLYEMFRPPKEIIRLGDDQRLLEYGFSLLKYPEKSRQMLQHLHAHPRERTHDEIEMRDGRVFDRRSGPVISADGKYCGRIWAFRDITEQKAMEVEREHLLAQTESLLAEALERADYDPLTGMLNHRAFHKKLKEEVLASQGTDRQGAVLLIDLDNFKFFNDAYGHLAGDDVLRQVALAFSAICRAQDTLARFGGDEFALLLPGASLADADRLAEDLRDAASLVSYQPPGYQTPIPFTLSIGIACFPNDASKRTDLLEVAGARLRISKSGGDDHSHAVNVRRSLAQSVGGFTMLDALVTSVDNKDRYTRRHSEDVLVYSLQIAQELELDADMRRTLEIAALLHDVGKIGVPDAILRKPGRLTDEESEAIQLHPMMGAVIVGAVAGFDETLDAIRHHHERWDGGGYPFGLRGEETPLSARLMAVADAYSAMTTDRPYRKGMDPKKALEILEAGAGTQWDPQCVRAFLCVRRRGESACG